MNYQIFRGDTVIANVVPAGTAEKGVMDLNTVNMTFDSPVPVVFHIGDYVDVYGERYWLFDFPSEKKLAHNKFAYQLEFKGIQYWLFKTNLLFPDSNNNYNQGRFALMGNADTIIDLIVTNMNRDNTDGPAWHKGTVEPTEYQQFMFNGDNCLAVLSNLATTYDTEFWVDADRSINLTLRQQNNGITLRYGPGEELYDIYRESVKNKVITRLYAEGGSKNIPGDYRNYSPRLQLPAPLAYLEKNVDIFGKNEDYQEFENIYPRRIGTVTSVLDKYTFSDSGIDFNVNDHLYPDQKAKLIFNTGQLAGLEFEIQYDPVYQRFTLIPNTSEKSLEVPNDLMYPVVGDKYVIEGIIMPQSYITAAENELLAAATKHINKYSVVEYNYTVTTNRIEVKSTGLIIRIGDQVRVIDDDLQLNALLRVITMSRNLQDWFDFSITLSTVVTVPQIVQVHNKINRAENVIVMNDLTNPNNARLNWRNQQQIISMVFDTEGNYYTEKISPITIETLSLAVGGKSQALSLVGVTIRPNLGGNPNALSISAGILNHFSIDPDAVKTWYISEYSTTFLVDNLAYYVYARCERNGTLGTWLVTTEQFKYDADPDYWLFLIGDIFAVYQGVRDFAFVYGQTYINGRTITTGRIQGLGGTYFDLDTGVISGKITFQAGTTGYANIADAPAPYDPGTVEGDVAYAIDTANAAQARIDDIVADNKLTPNEKQMLQKEVIVIQGERNTIIAQANTYGISTVNYVAGYDVLMNYILPLIADLTTTAVVTGSVLRANFKNYYDTKVLLLRQISDASRNYTDTLRGDLGDVAFDDKIEFAKMGNTVVNGAYLKTGIIDTNAIRIGNGSDYPSGRILNRDKTFANGANGITTYNNLANGTVAVGRVASAGTGFNPPNNSGYMMYIYYNGGGASPGLGGWYFATPTRANAKFICKFVAWIPAGFQVNWASNAIGDGGTCTWNTPQVSTGTWTEYICTVQCGNTGTFSSTNFFYLTGPNVALYWYLSYATVFDLSADEVDYLTDAQNKANTAYTNAYNNSTSYANSQDVAYYNSSISYANNRVTTLQNSLGGLAYDNVVEYAKLGSTVIDNGYIKTTLIDTVWLKANVINVSYIEGLTLNFVRGTIANWYIASDRIYSSNAYSAIELVTGVDPRLAMSTYRDAPVTAAQAAGGASGGSLGSISYSGITPECIYALSAGRESGATGNIAVGSFKLKGNPNGYTRVALECESPVDSYSFFSNGRARFDEKPGGYAIEAVGTSWFRSSVRFDADIIVQDGAAFRTGFTGTANFLKFVKGICWGPV